MGSWPPTTTVLLVVTYAQDARQSLRNVARHHDDVVNRRFGRAALFEGTGRGAFLALWLQEKHGVAVEVRYTEPFNEFDAVPAAVREAAAAYHRRAHPNTPYAKFAAGSDHPSMAELESLEV